VKYQYKRGVGEGEGEKRVSGGKKLKFRRAMWRERKEKNWIWGRHLFELSFSGQSNFGKLT